MRLILRGKQWLNAQEIIQRGALALVHPPILGRAGGGGALVGRQTPELAEGTRYSAALIERKRAELLHGATDLRALIEREVLHDLRVCQEALTLLGWHGVELGEAIAHALLSLLGELLKAWLMLQCALLLIGREVAVQIHPLREVLAARTAKLWISSGGGCRLPVRLLLLRWWGATLDGSRSLANLRKDLAIRANAAIVYAAQLRGERRGSEQDRHPDREGGSKGASWNEASHGSYYSLSGPACVLICPKPGVGLLRLTHDAAAAERCGPIIPKPPSAGGGFLGRCDPSSV